MTVGQSAEWLPRIGGMCGWHHTKMRRKKIKKKGLNVVYLQKIKIVFER
jgi:hypothetical protein